MLRLGANVLHKTRRIDEATEALENAARVSAQQNAKLWLLRTRIDQYKMAHVTADELTAALSAMPDQANPPEIAIATVLLQDT